MKVYKYPSCSRKIGSYILRISKSFVYWITKIYESI
jgi:hypothetical protein